ncbi:MAG: 30S ribosomal protein THX [Spirochaetota bacterium]
MGRGDQRTRRGKIWRSTYGKTRPRKARKKRQK